MFKQKVMILNHGLASGGTDSFVVNVLKGLDKNKFSPSLIMAVDKGGKKQFREDEIEQLKIPIYHTCDLNSIKKVFLHAICLYKLLKHEKPDVFHANMDLFNGLNMFVAWTAKVPIRVCHSHNSNSQYETNTDRHLVVKIYRYIMRRMAWTFSNRRCGCSEAAMHYLFENRWVKDENSSIIYNGIDFEKFEKEIDRQTKLEEMGLDPAKHYMIVVGRLAKQKNPMFIVEIIKDLCKSRNDLKLLWVGCGEMEEKIKKAFKENGIAECVEMLGSRKDVSEILRCGEVFLMPSLYEGLPIALLEAQAAGLTAVVSNKVSREANLGKAIFLAIDEGTDQWKSSILEIIDGTIGLKLDDARKQLFSVAHMVNQLESIYL